MQMSQISFSNELYSGGDVVARGDQSSDDFVYEVQQNGRMNDDLPSFLQDFKDIFQEYFDSPHQLDSFLMKLNAI